MVEGSFPLFFLMERGEVLGQGILGMVFCLMAGNKKKIHLTIWFFELLGQEAISLWDVR